MKQKGLAPLVIIILIALAVGGYLLYQKQLKPAAVPQPASQSSPTSATSAETANPDLIGATWKTYTNTKYKYKISYPEESRVNSVSSPQDKTDVSLADSMQIALAGGNPLLIQRYNNAEKLSVFDFVKNLIKKNKEEAGLGKVPLMGISKEKIVTVGNNIPAYSYELFAYDRTDTIIWVAKDNNAFLFGFKNGEQNPNYPYAERDFKIFNQILSTFKFIP